MANATQNTAKSGFAVKFQLHDANVSFNLFTKLFYSVEFLFRTDEA